MIKTEYACRVVHGDPFCLGMTLDKCEFCGLVIGGLCLQLCCDEQQNLFTAARERRRREWLATRGEEKEGIGDS